MNLFAYLNNFIYLLLPPSIRFIYLLVCHNSNCNFHELIFFIHIAWVMTSKKFQKLDDIIFIFFLCDLSAFHDAIPTMFLSPSMLNIARSHFAKSSHFALAASLCVMLMRPTMVLIDRIKHCLIVMSVHVPPKKREVFLLIVTNHLIWLS